MRQSINLPYSLPLSDFISFYHLYITGVHNINTMCDHHDFYISVKSLNVALLVFNAVEKFEVSLSLTSYKFLGGWGIRQVVSSPDHSVRVPPPQLHHRIFLNQLFT